MRAVLELAGIHDILTKSLGSNNPINVVYATFEALQFAQDGRTGCALRGKDVAEFSPNDGHEEEILGQEATPRPRTKRAAAAKLTRVAPRQSRSSPTLRSQIRPKRSPGASRIGRGHGSGMVKTGGEGGKGQTVRSGGGKGPAFEGGQTPWARRLPQTQGCFAESARHRTFPHALCGRSTSASLQTGTSSLEVDAAVAAEQPAKSSKSQRRRQDSRRTEAR